MDGAVAFVAGALTKFSDGGEDELKAVCSALAGLFHTYLMLRPDLFPLVVGTVLGNVLAGKVDTLPHRISASITLFFSPFADHTFAVLSVPVVLASYLDERIPTRPLLPLLSVLLIPVLGVHQLFVFLLWEAGYRAASYFIQRVKR